jgi:hypothetical protein
VHTMGQGRGGGWWLGAAPPPTTPYHVAVNVMVVPFARFSIEDPFEIPAACERVPLRLATKGEAPRLATSVAAFFDEAHLNVVFSGADDAVVATHLEHDAPLYEEDVVEVFLAPARLTEYFELEVNPLGATFDARIESPDGVRATMLADAGWTCENLLTAIRRDGDAFDVLLRIPFASLGTPRPAHGDEWRGNFFRIDRHPERPGEFTAWQPTMRTPADFHVAAAFGKLRFEHG